MEIPSAQIHLPLMKYKYYRIVWIIALLCTLRVSILGTKFSSYFLLQWMFEMLDIVKGLPFLFPGTSCQDLRNIWIIWRNGFHGGNLMLWFPSHVRKFSRSWWWSPGWWHEMCARVRLVSNIESPLCDCKKLSPNVSHRPHAFAL